MSALRLVYFNPTTTAQFPHHFSPSKTLLPISHTTTRRRPNLQLFILRAQTEAQSQAHPAFELETIEENVVGEEEVDVSNTRVLVQNVPWTCTADELRPLIGKYGTVLDIEFSMYNKSRNRGLAFVTMATHEEALAVVNNLESTEFEGRVLRLNWAKPTIKKLPSPPPQPKPLPVHNLFIANLSFQARAKDVKEFFNDGDENGKVVSAEVIFQDNPRRSAGYGFVSFNTKADAEAALASFNGKEFMGRPIRLARSKRFLRQETKVVIESESAEST